MILHIKSKYSDSESKSPVWRVENGQGKLFFLSATFMTMENLEPKLSWSNWYFACTCIQKSALQLCFWLPLWCEKKRKRINNKNKKQLCPLFCFCLRSWMSSEVQKCLEKAKYFHSHLLSLKVKFKFGPKKLSRQRFLQQLLPQQLLFCFYDEKFP